MPACKDVVETFLAVADGNHGRSAARISDPGTPCNGQGGSGPPAGRAAIHECDYFSWLSFCSIFGKGIAPGTRSPSAKNMVGVPLMLRRRPNS